MSQSAAEPVILILTVRRRGWWGRRRVIRSRAGAAAVSLTANVAHAHGIAQRLPPQQGARLDDINVDVVHEDLPPNEDSIQRLAWDLQPPLYEGKAQRRDRLKKRRAVCVEHVLRL
eukprot:scaffold108711_cov59-Phaeocystis_antarctica.AAC.3